MLKNRADERFNRTEVEVPAAYKKTTHQPTSNIIDDEGRQIATLVYAPPAYHAPPPLPSDQALTTKLEQFLAAAWQELEDRNGPVWWQCTLAQVHDNIGWIYFAPKRKPYADQPKAPADDASQEDMDDYAGRNDRYKRDAGVSGVFDYEYAVTGTMLPVGNVYDPDCVYVRKEVSASELKKYGVTRNEHGELNKVELGQTGYPQGTSSAEQMVTVVEYWDKHYCFIVAEDARMARSSTGRFVGKAAFTLAEWQHDFGRVPYFARPAFVTEQLDEDKKFAGPLDALYTAIAAYKRLIAMADAASYQTTFSPLQVITREKGEMSLDDEGMALTFLELEPGKARQMGPGQEVKIIPQSPEIANLWQQLAVMRQEIERYTLSPIAKGVAPGADTANAMVSNLRTFQLSTLKPMAEQEARQGRAMARFALEQIRKMEETVYVLPSQAQRDAYRKDPELRQAALGDESYLALNAEDVITVNIDVKAVPDQGQMKLLLEKHAIEWWIARAWSRAEMYDKMGYENPEQKAQEVEIEDYAQTLKPVVWQQVTAQLGLLDAINRMVQANAGGGSARDAIPGIMADARGAQDGQPPSGMGSGRPGQPRANGRGIDPNVNTQEAQALGMDVGY